MKKIFFLYLLLMLVSSGLPIFAQSEINQFDAQGKRHGVWKKTYPGTQQLRYEGTFEHGKEIGEFRFYCAECNDKPSVVKNFNGEDDTAKVKYFTIKGKLVSEGKMKGKDRVGEWVYYHEKSQQPMIRETYVDGKLDAKQITYYPNGTITQETEYKNGVKQGQENYYSPEGILLKKLFYQNGKLQGPATYYDANGNVVIKGFYKEDKKHGLWQYYQDGKLVLEETFPKKEE